MSGSKHGIGSDLAKVDAYQNTVEDYDEIPEVTDDNFARAVPHRAGKPVRGRPPLGAASKKTLSLRLDPSIEKRFRASGPGWQVRMDAFLQHNEVVLTMIVEFDEMIVDMEKLLAIIATGGLRPLFEPAQTAVDSVERRIGHVKGTVRGLREQLVWDDPERSRSCS